jgi:hypothetical protein
MATGAGTLPGHADSVEVASILIEMASKECDSHEATRDHGLHSDCTKGAFPRRTRPSRCGRCPGCTATRCGKCKECHDSLRFGGPGKRKRLCVARACTAVAPVTRSELIALLVEYGQPGGCVPVGVTAEPGRVESDGG